MKPQTQPEETADNGSNEPMKKRMLKIEARLPHRTTGQGLNEPFKAPAGRQPDAKMSVPLWMWPPTLNLYDGGADRRHYTEPTINPPGD